MLHRGGGYRPPQGSKEHPHLPYKAWWSYYLVLRRYLIKKIRQKDRDTLLLRAEAMQMFESLYKRPQHIRNGTPQERADAILANGSHHIHHWRTS